MRMRDGAQRNFRARFYAGIALLELGEIKRARKHFTQCWRQLVLADKIKGLGKVATLKQVMRDDTEGLIDEARMAIPQLKGAPVIDRTTVEKYLLLSKWNGIKEVASFAPKGGGKSPKSKMVDKEQRDEERKAIREEAERVGVQLDSDSESESSAGQSDAEPEMLSDYEWETDDEASASDDSEAAKEGADDEGEEDSEDEFEPDGAAAQTVGRRARPGLRGRRRGQPAAGGRKATKRADRGQGAPRGAARARGRAGRARDRGARRRVRDACAQEGRRPEARRRRVRERVPAPVARASGRCPRSSARR